MRIVGLCKLRNCSIFGLILIEVEIFSSLIVRVVTEFYRPRLERRLGNFTKQLKELDDYATELRKIENPLRVLTGEEKTERTIMALRNYHVMLKSLDSMKKKVSELPEVVAVFKSVRTFKSCAKVVHQMMSRLVQTLKYRWFVYKQNLTPSCAGRDYSLVRCFFVIHQT